MEGSRTLKVSTVYWKPLSAKNPSMTHFLAYIYCSSKNLIWQAVEVLDELKCLYRLQWSSTRSESVLTIPVADEGKMQWNVIPLVALDQKFLINFESFCLKKFAVDCVQSYSPHWLTTKKTQPNTLKQPADDRWIQFGVCYLLHMESLVLYYTHKKRWQESKHVVSELKCMLRTSWSFSWARECIFFKHRIRQESRHAVTNFWKSTRAV